MLWSYRDIIPQHYFFLLLIDSSTLRVKKIDTRNEKNMLLERLLGTRLYEYVGKEKNREFYILRMTLKG